jgi:hypothetical protein
MGNKGCPHCGNVLPNESRRCTCGFTFDGDGPEVRGAQASRDRSDDTLGRSRKPPASRVERPGKPPSAKKDRRPEPPGPSASRPRGDAADPSRLMDCPFCSARISKRAQQCPKCGKEPFLDCGICGASIVASAAACPECGDPDPFNP